MNGYKLIVGSKNYSSWSLRGWLSMRQSGATFEEIFIPFHTEERGELIRKHSPSGLVPVLLDGDLLINDSLAIAEYLAEQHPTAGLWPDDPTARAVARAAAAEMHSRLWCVAVGPADEFPFGPRRSRAERRSQRGRPAHRGRLA